MVNEKDFHYMEQALAEIKAIEGYTKGLSYGEFVEDGKTVDATMFRLQQMVEWMKKLSLGFREGHPEIPWGQIIGFRNGIVHEYAATDYTMVYEIITNDIFDLKKLFESSLKSPKAK